MNQKKSLLILSTFALFMIMAASRADTSVAGLISTVHFNSGQATFSNTLPIDNEIVPLIKDSTTLLSVRGYTDPRGSARYNLALSERRVQAVRDYLIRKGFKPNQLDIKSYGKSQTTAKHPVPNCDKTKGNNKKSCQSLYRRVEVEVLRGSYIGPQFKPRGS